MLNDCYRYAEGGKLKDKTRAPSIYVAAADSGELRAVLHDRDLSEHIRGHHFVSRQERLTDQAKSVVLKLTLNDSARMASVARLIEKLGGRFGRLRLDNVDLQPAQ